MFLMYKNSLWKSLVGAFWQRSLSQILGWRVIRLAGCPQVVMHLPVSVTVRRRETMGDHTPDVFQSTYSSTSASSVVQVCTLFHFLDQWRSITSNKFVLNVVKGEHLQLKKLLLLLCNFYWFNIKAPKAHNPPIQKNCRSF